MSERVRKQHVSMVDEYASDVLELALSGKPASDIWKAIVPLGCEASERTVRRWIENNAATLTALRQERVRNIANSSEFTDRVNRTSVMSRAARKLVKSLSSPADPGDMEFLNGASLPMLRELRDLFKQLQDEVNDIEQPAKRMELLGPDGGAIQVQEVRRTIVG